MVYKILAAVRCEIVVLEMMKSENLTTTLARYSRTKDSATFEKMTNPLITLRTPESTTINQRDLKLKRMTPYPQPEDARTRSGDR